MANPPNPRHATALSVLNAGQVSRVTEQIMGRMTATQLAASERSGKSVPPPARLKVPSTLSSRKKAALIELEPEKSFVVNVIEILIEPKRANAHFACIAARYLATERWANIEDVIISAIDGQAFKHPLYRRRVYKSQATFLWARSKSEFLPDSTSSDLQRLVDYHTGLQNDIHISLNDLSKRMLPMKVAVWLSDPKNSSDEEWASSGEASFLSASSKTHSVRPYETGPSFTSATSYRSAAPHRDPEEWSMLVPKKRSGPDLDVQPERQHRAPVPVLATAGARYISRSYARGLQTEKLEMEELLCTIMGDESASPNIWCTGRVVAVTLGLVPFSHGTTKSAFKLWRTLPDGVTTELCAAKRIFADTNGMPPTKESNRRHLEDEMTRQAIADDILAAFDTATRVAHLRVYPLEIAKASLLVATSGQQEGWAYLVEPFLPGNVMKFSGTDDAGNHPPHEVPGATCDAFAHFALAYTQGMFKARKPGSLGEVTPLVLFDLQTQTVDGNSGFGDMGLPGIKRDDKSPGSPRRTTGKKHGFDSPQKAVASLSSNAAELVVRNVVRGAEQEDGAVNDAAIHEPSIRLPADDNRMETSTGTEVQALVEPPPTANPMVPAPEQTMERQEPSQSTDNRSDTDYEPYSILILPSETGKTLAPARVVSVDRKQAAVTMEWLSFIRWPRNEVPTAGMFATTINACRAAENLMVRNKAKLAKLSWPRKFEFPPPTPHVKATSAMEHVMSNLAMIVSMLAGEVGSVVMDEWTEYAAHATTRRAERLTFEFVEPREVKGLFEEEKAALDDWLMQQLAPAMLMKFSDDSLRSRLIVAPGAVLTSVVYTQAILASPTRLSIDEVYSRRKDLVRGKTPLVFRAWEAMKAVHMAPIHDEGNLATSHRSRYSFGSERLWKMRYQSQEHGAMPIARPQTGNVLMTGGGYSPLFLDSKFLGMIEAETYVSLRLTMPDSGLMTVSFAAPQPDKGPDQDVGVIDINVHGEDVYAGIFSTGNVVHLHVYATARAAVLWRRSMQSTTRNWTKDGAGTMGEKERLDVPVPCQLTRLGFLRQRMMRTNAADLLWSRARGWWVADRGNTGIMGVKKMAQGQRMKREKERGRAIAMERRLSGTFWDHIIETEYAQCLEVAKEGRVIYMQLEMRYD
ncbi:hypothetical protein CALCODRAFT_507259 [Calocera cornea HHB12733]|uniref:Alpha-type protein kinase domain-containing protein n=1 Tax=Calocera cornea HHB12733 TaxID=1353952 RepID=A0A165HYG0_9BASI|nr:hypothetical protein CALCODRAFT_507259 [Calocera cornea HHB12733]